MTQTQAPQGAGGSFAPPLTDELLTKYEALTASASAEVKDAMTELLACCRAWWSLPESSPKGRQPHPSGMGVHNPLDQEIADQLDPVIPYARELKSMGDLFDTIDTTSQKELRDAAFHLLWHAKELEIGREPITTDTLK